MNRVVPNGTLRGVEGEVKISPIRLNEIEKAGITTALITNITAVAKSIGTDRVIEKSVKAMEAAALFFCVGF